MNTLTDIRNVAVNVTDQDAASFDDPDNNRFYVIEDQP